MVIFSSSPSKQTQQEFSECSLVSWPGQNRKLWKGSGEDHFQAEAKPVDGGSQDVSGAERRLKRREQTVQRGGSWKFFSRLSVIRRRRSDAEAWSTVNYVYVTYLPEGLNAECTSDSEDPELLKQLWVLKWETIFSYKGKHTSNMEASHSTPRYLSTRNENICAHKDFSWIYIAT